MTTKKMSEFFVNVMDQLPLGLFILDKSRKICEWNLWMAEKTSVQRSDSLGKQLKDIFYELDHARFDWALDMVLSSAAPQLLSQALNQYVFPMPLKLVNHFGLDMMQQKVQVSPLTMEDGSLAALITVVDVTENAIQEKSLQELAARLKETSYRDPLTNLFNRRFMTTWLSQEMLSANRYDFPLACLMIDVDFFKKINDTHGHEVGDKVLVDLGKLMNELLRQSDICVRYGGEEFVIILSHCALKDAMKRATSFLEAVRLVSLGGLGIGQVTCSIGVSVSSVGKAYSSDNLLLMADKKLYKAKISGRNQVCG
jgi:diguanylate cyclase (GGDEF)-like protein